MGVAASEVVESATVGDCSGDCVGTSANRVVTNMGGSRGVVAYRSASISLGSTSKAFALAMSMGDVAMSSSRCSLLLRIGVGDSMP